MELFLNDLFEFFIEIISIPPKVFTVYFKIMFHPFSYFNNPELELDFVFKYFGAGLTLIAFLFNYTTPSKEYSDNKFIKWIIQIPISKLKGLISKGGVIYLTVLSSIPVFLFYLIFYLFSGNNSFKLYFDVLLFALGTIYLTVSFLIMAENLVMKGFGKLSILEAWKTTMAEGMELENNFKNNPLPIEDDKKEDKKISFWQAVVKRAEFGTIAASPFQQKISGIQSIFVNILMMYGFLYPFFCLFILP